MTAVVYLPWQAGQRITASQLTAMQALQVVKPADESVTSSTTMQNDNDLVAPVVANAVYQFWCAIEWEGLIFSTSSGGIKTQWVPPAGSSMRFTMSTFGPGGGWNGVASFASDPQPSGGNGAGNIRPLFMAGSLTTSGTPGNLQLQWAQNFSSAVPTIVHGQSGLWLVRTQ